VAWTAVERNAASYRRAHLKVVDKGGGSLCVFEIVPMVVQHSDPPLKFVPSGLSIVATVCGSVNHEPDANKRHHAADQ
jgi:hypothetical protein